MIRASLLAGVAGSCAVLAAWDALVAAEEARVVQAVGRWVSPALTAVRSGRDPTSPERRRLALVGALVMIGGGWLIAGPWAGLALGTAAPWVASALLRARARRWRAALAAAAPAVARALADALAGGHSVRGAMEAAAHGGGVPQPAGAQLRAAAVALELGEPTEDVLRALARRAGPGPYETLTAAILLQRDAGGDLAGLLRSLAGTLEERARVEDDARSATAQARFTAMIVGGLPAAGIAIGGLLAPDLIVGLVSAPLPASLAGTAVVLQLLAVVVVRRIGRLADA